MAVTFQDTILRLQAFWAGRGCLIWQPVNTEVGAGTMNPATFLRVLGPEPWHVAYVEPSVRPDDSRYGENPNRIQTHTQFQVILKPGPDDPQQLYLDSLAAIGIDTAREDIRFVEDNWQQPALGAWGLGWEVWLDGLEITQFTYFQQAGGIALDPVPVEITYGLERIVMAQQGARRFQEIEYAPGISYGEALGRSEYEWSVYYLDRADVERTRQQFSLHEQEARALIGARLALPAYAQLLRTSHLFNVLDARGAVGVAERAAYFARMRGLARTISELWLGTEPAPRPSPVPAGPRAQAELAPVDGPRDLLLELGVEELPPGDLDAAIRHLRAAAPGELERRGLEADAIEAHGTPRRIVLTATGLRAGAAELVRGPAWHVAFGEDGTPGKAGEGFARKHGIAASELVQVEHDGQTFAAAAGREVDVRTAAADAAEALLSGIPYARGMRWNASQVMFARPARWIAALLGEDVLPVRFAGLTAGRTTRTLRGAAPVELATAADHAAVLERAGIVLDEAVRERGIATRAAELAAEAGGSISVGQGEPLMGEVTNLVEAPMPLLGSIDPEFLELPDPVLSTVMRRHQRYLPVERDGRLLPAFVAVANGAIDPDAVRAGNEAVLRARFADARFFIAQDEQRPLEEFRKDLAGIVFEESLGTMLEKSERVEALTAELAPLLIAEEEYRATAIRAAALAKADLATQMVMEMTSLAGTMGGIYARRAGESEAVATAIETHVRPAYAGDRLPLTIEGAVIGIADRLDSLAGLMAAGHAASSTSDPFGLRRAALGILQTAVAREVEIDLEDAVARAAALQPVAAGLDVQAAVVEFLWRRFEIWQREMTHPADIVRAAVQGGSPSPLTKARTIWALGELAPTQSFAALHETWMRAARLARRQPVEGPVDPALLAEPAEQALLAGARTAEEAIAADPTVAGVVAALTPLAPLITAFFEQVFVMADDEALARNRLALVRDVAALPAPVADLAELGESLAAPSAV